MELTDLGRERRPATLVRVSRPVTKNSKTETSHIFHAIAWRPVQHGEATRLRRPVAYTEDRIGVRPPQKVGDAVLDETS